MTNILSFLPRRETHEMQFTSHVFYRSLVPLTLSTSPFRLREWLPAHLWSKANCIVNSLPTQTCIYNRYKPEYNQYVNVKRLHSSINRINLGTFLMFWRHVENLRPMLDGHRVHYKDSPAIVENTRPHADGGHTRTVKTEGFYLKDSDTMHGLVHERVDYKSYCDTEEVHSVFTVKDGVRHGLFAHDD